MLIAVLPFGHKYAVVLSLVLSSWANYIGVAFIEGLFCCSFGTWIPGRYTKVVYYDLCDGSNPSCSVAATAYSIHHIDHSRPIHSTLTSNFPKDCMVVNI